MPQATIETTVHVVLRPFEGAGLRRETGEVVDTAEWRYVRQLVATRYLAPAPRDLKPVACACGRSWASQGALRTHGCKPRAQRPAKAPKAKAPSKPVQRRRTAKSPRRKA